MSFKFCPECGAAASPNGHFCAGCGTRLGSASSAAALPRAGLVSLVTLLLLGGGFWLYFRLAPPETRPLKPGEGRPAAAPPPAGDQAPAPGGAGEGHPPIALPDDIKQFMTNLAKEAEAKPKDVAAWEKYARVYYRASRLDRSHAAKAEQAFNHLIELDPKNLEGLRGLANLAYDRQERPRAIEFYERYLAVKPDDPEVRTDMATMYFESGDAERAIKEYERVGENNPTFYQAQFNLAVVYDSRGDSARARTYLEKARDLATEPEVKQRMGALLEGTAGGKSFQEAAASIGGSGGSGGTAAAGGDSRTATGPGAGPGGGAGATTSPRSGGAMGAAGAGGAPAGAGTNAAAATFPASVEQLFRTHPIAGPRIVEVTWPSADRGRVVFADFPMQAMPDSMRESYLGKMKKGVDDARARFAVSGPVTVELVDRATGEVMATVTP